MERRPSLLLLFGSLFLFALFMLACQQQPRPIDTGGAPLDLSELLLDKDLQSLGRNIFFDSTLSTPPGQACAACHSSEVGWTGPDEELNKRGSVYPGAVHTRFGNRKPNASAYATLTPSFRALRKGEEVVFVGGDFWDGRATGWKLGNPAADQAQGPFLNPVEQNIADAKAVLGKICASTYAEEFRRTAKRIWDIDDVCASDVEFAYGIVAIAIAAFEHSPDGQPVFLQVRPVPQGQGCIDGGGEKRTGSL